MLAANAGSEVGQHNAGFLFAEKLPKLPLAVAYPAMARAYGLLATKFYKLAALQGSAAAQLQLALMVSYGGKNYAMANELLTAAYQAGSTDALWHLGYNYWKGHGGASGAERNRGLALKYIKLAGFSSKHAKLRGVDGLFFGTLALGYKAAPPPNPPPNPPPTHPLPTPYPPLPTPYPPLIHPLPTPYPPLTHPLPTPYPPPLPTHSAHPLCPPTLPTHSTHPLYPPPPTPPYKARIPLILGAVAATLFATGDPLQKIAALRPGGGRNIPQWEDEGDDDFDDFDED